MDIGLFATCAGWTVLLGSVDEDAAVEGVADDADMDASFLAIDRRWRAERGGC